MSTIIGFVNSFEFIPSPLVILLRDNGELFAVYPDGRKYRVIGESDENERIISVDTNAALYREGEIAFSITSTHVILCAKSQLRHVLRNALNDGFYLYFMLSDEAKFDLIEFLDQIADEVDASPSLPLCRIINLATKETDIVNIETDESALIHKKIIKSMQFLCASNLRRQQDITQTRFLCNERNGYIEFDYKSAFEEFVRIISKKHILPKKHQNHRDSRYFAASKYINPKRQTANYQDTKKRILSDIFPNYFSFVELINDRSTLKQDLLGLLQPYSHRNLYSTRHRVRSNIEVLFIVSPVNREFKAIEMSIINDFYQTKCINAALLNTAKAIYSHVYYGEELCKTAYLGTQEPVIDNLFLSALDLWTPIQEHTLSNHYECLLGADSINLMSSNVSQIYVEKSTPIAAKHFTEEYDVVVDGKAITQESAYLVSCNEGREYSLQEISLSEFIAQRRNESFEISAKLSEMLTNEISRSENRFEIFERAANEYSRLLNHKPI